jgi:hypothetical protein
VSNHHVNLTRLESSLIGESHPAALERMDEKQLKDLQSRLRTAREKNFSLLRRHTYAVRTPAGGRNSAELTDRWRGPLGTYAHLFANDHGDAMAELGQMAGPKHQCDQRHPATGLGSRRFSRSHLPIGGLDKGHESNE